MTDKMPQWIAFGIAACMSIVAVMLFLCYQDIHATHTQVTGKMISVDSRTTRVNDNSTRRLFHLIVTLPFEGEERAFILKEGGPQRIIQKGKDISLIYPNGQVEDVRVLRATDRLWPTILSAFIGSVALFAGMLFRREMKVAANRISESDA